MERGPANAGPLFSTNRFKQSIVDYMEPNECLLVGLRLEEGQHAVEVTP